MGNKFLPYEFCFTKHIQSLYKYIQITNNEYFWSNSKSKIIGASQEIQVTESWAI